MNNLYKSYYKQLEINFRLRLSKGQWERYRALIVSSANTIHEGYESKDKRRLKRTLRVLGYIN